MSEDEANLYSEVGAKVDDALRESVTARRHAVEEMTRRNDAAIQAFAAQGAGISQVDVMNLRLMVLLECILGDMDTPARLSYEERVQLVFSEKLAEFGAQVARARLTQPGIVPPQPGQGGNGLIIPPR